MLKKVQKFMQQNNMIEKGNHVIVGVSGGADSVCLLFVLKELQSEIGFAITAVHVNHGIRGVEAYRDQHFVEELCRNLNVELKCFEKDIPDIARECKLSLEEAGRKVRYDIFAELSSSVPNGKIAVAHHMDDQSETVLMNIFRGSGIKGACGIHPVRNGIIRPLLCVRRTEIEKYLDEKCQDYVTDSTNQDVTYTRNRIRNEVIPYIREHINNSAVENIAAMADSIRDAEMYIYQQSQKTAMECVYRENDNILIQLESFSCKEAIIKKYIIRDILGELAGKLKDICKIHIDSVLELEQKGVGSHVDLAYRISAEREYESIRLSVKKENDSMQKGVDMQAVKSLNYPIELADLESGKSVFIEVDGEWYIQNEFQRIKGINVHILNESELQEVKKEKKIVENHYTKLFDYDKIKFTFHLRTRKTGDKIQINGDGGSKKLKDYYIDAKIPAVSRDKVPVFACDSDVLWVVGQRISEKFKITEETTRILKIDIDTED